MPIDYTITYLAIVVISIELVLMTYGFLASPYTFANRVFALLMLALAGGAASILFVVTAPTFLVAAVGVWVHAFATFCATALLAFLLVALVTPDFRYSRQSLWLISGVWAVSVFLLVLDLFVPANLVFRFEAASYTRGYVSLAAYLTGLAGPFLYALNVKYTHLLFPLLVIVSLFTGIVSPQKKVLARRLLVILLVMYVINGLAWWRVPRIAALMGSLSIATIATWAILRYRVLSPVTVGMQQALDTAAFGLMVFDQNWHLLESNQAARHLLGISSKNHDQTLFTILTYVAETAVNREGILTFLQKATKVFSEDRSLGVILSSSSKPESVTWLYLQFSLIYEREHPLGILCTIEDQTAVRQAQNRLESANESLEQFAYRTTLLNDITRTGISGLDMNTMLQRFADRLGDLFLAEGCYITIWDEEQQKAKPTAAYGPLHSTYATLSRISDYPSVTETVLTSGRPLVIANIDQSPYSYFYQFEAFQGTSMFALPLIISGQKLGAILIIFDDKYVITPDKIALGEQAASQIALAIARDRLLQSEREQRVLAQTLHNIGMALTATLDYESLLDTILAQIQLIVPYDTANVSLLEEGIVRLVRVQGYESFTDLPPDQLAGEPFSLTTIATFRTMVETKQPLCLSDVCEFEGWTVTEATRHIQSWIGVPLLIADAVAGFLCVDKTEPGFYREHHKTRLAGLTHQVALALQHAQLFTESRRQAQQLAVLNGLSAKMVGLVNVQEVTDLVATRLREDFQYHNVAIFIVDVDQPQDMVLHSVAGAYESLLKDADYRQPVGKGIIGQAVARGECVLENDTLSNSDFFQLPEFNIRSELAVPIKTDTAVLGAINVDSQQPFTFTSADVALLTTMADQMAVAIQKARLFEQTHERARELEILGVMTADLREAHSVADMLPIVLENIVHAINASVGVIYLLDQEKQQVVSVAGYPPGGYPLGLAHQLGQGITGHVAATGKTYVSKDLQTDERFYLHEGEEAYRASLRTGIALPLQTEGQIIGVIHIGMAYEYHFTPFEVQLLTSMTDVTANALHRAQVMESLEERVNERTRELQAAYVRLQELDQLKSKFISDVTHELRTPVANMSLYLDLLKMGRPDKQEHYLQVIESQTARLAQLVETTLQVSGPNVIVEPSDFQAVPLAEVVNTAVKSFTPRLAVANLELILAISSDVPPVWGDARQLSQVVVYLLANAVNYTHNGSITISLTFHSGEQVVCLKITDTGMGIDDQDQPYIFDRFYRGHKVGQLTIPGVGLGLTLAKEIVERHNGRIKLYSIPDQGTTVTVKLPLAPHHA